MMPESSPQPERYDYADRRRLPDRRKRGIQFGLGYERFRPNLPVISGTCPVCCGDVQMRPHGTPECLHCGYAV